jgi:hypothetical protein
LWGISDEQQHFDPPMVGLSSHSQWSTMATLYPWRTPWLMDEQHKTNNKFKATAQTNFGETT